MRRIAFVIAPILGILIAWPAAAQVVITQAKALAGSITPGDTAGYPITLSQPGAYVLGSNLTVPSGIYGISAGVDNIDLDLNGFVISGGGVATYGFVTAKGQGHIHGGVIKAFKISGVYIRGEGWVIEGMQIVRNGAMGIDATNTAGVTVKDCHLSWNGSYGAYVRKGTFESNTVSNNTSIGIFVERFARIESNYIENNSKGILINEGGLITGNSIIANRSYGIDNGTATVSITNNVLVNNNGVAKQIFGGNDVYGNTCIGGPC